METMDRFRTCFAALAHPRRGNAQGDDLLGILPIARLDGGIPSHGTFRRLFRMLDPPGFETCCQRFVPAFGEQIDAEGIIAVAGKTIGRRFDRRNERSALHMVGAWSVGQRPVPGRRKVDEEQRDRGRAGAPGHARSPPPASPGSPAPTGRSRAA
jgi:hypothetical protein